MPHELKSSEIDLKNGVDENTENEIKQNEKKQRPWK